ncbi:hypothetical protein Tco_1334819 [Tanacetum coccineum]
MRSVAPSFMYENLKEYEQEQKCPHPLFVSNPKKHINKPTRDPRRILKPQSDVLHGFVTCLTQKQMGLVMGCIRMIWREKDDKSVFEISDVLEDLSTTSKFHICFEWLSIWGEAVELLEDMRYELGEVNSIYTDYIVFPTSEEMIQAEVLVEDKANYRYL